MKGAARAKGITCKKPRRSYSLKVSDSFTKYVIDQLNALEDVAAKAIFGGAGLYCQGVFFVRSFTRRPRKTG